MLYLKKMDAMQIYKKYFEIQSIFALFIFCLYWHLHQDYERSGAFPPIL